MTQAIPNRKVSVKVQKADGHVYFMSIDAQHLTASKDETANKFAGIMVQEIPSNITLSITILEQIEEQKYSGWLAIKEGQNKTFHLS